MTSPDRCTNSTNNDDALAALVAHRHPSLALLGRREGSGSYPDAMTSSDTTAAAAPSPPSSLGRTQVSQLQQQQQQQQERRPIQDAARLKKFLTILHEAMDLVNDEEDDDWL
jgi:uncharacterized protein (DUF885 family)